MKVSKEVDLDCNKRNYKVAQNAIMYTNKTLASD